MRVQNELTVEKIIQRIAGRLDVAEPPMTSQRQFERDAANEIEGMVMNAKSERIKNVLRKIPVISTVIIWLYRFAKMPWRVLRTYEVIQPVDENMLRWEQKLDLLISSAREIKYSVDASNHKWDAAIADITQVKHRMEKIGTHITSWIEKADSYSWRLNSKLDAIRPVINAGNNLVITKVDDFIMGFPAEEWRLPAYQILRGYLEPGLVKVLSNVVSEGTVFIDVGANVGMYTLIALRQCGVNGRVYSFEPTPRIFDILKNNIQVNGYLESERIMLHQAAVTDTMKNKVKFFVYKNSLTHNTLYRDEGADCVEIEIDTIALDILLAGVPRVDVIKIDAEGAEPLVLRGMRQIIANNPQLIVFIEFAPAHLQRSGINVSQFITEIRNYGFIIRQVSEPTGEVAPISDQELLECYSLNLMLTRE